MSGWGTYLRGLWKQRPSAWGPAHVVESVLRNRFEDTYGIKWSDIVLALPFWGPGNQTDYANGLNAVNYNAEFIRNSINTSTSSGLYIQDDPKLRVSELTLIIDITILATPDRYARIFEKEYTAGTVTPYVSFGFETYYTQLRFSAATTAVTANNLLSTPVGTLSVGESNVFTGVHDSLIGRKVYKDSELIASSSNSLGDITYYSDTGNNLDIGYLSHANTNYQPIEIRSAFLLKTPLDQAAVTDITENINTLWQPPTFRTFSLPAGTPTIFNLAALHASKPTRIIQ